MNAARWKCCKCTNECTPTEDAVWPPLKVSSCCDSAIYRIDEDDEPALSAAQIIAREAIEAGHRGDLDTACDLLQHALQARCQAKAAQ